MFSLLSKNTILYGTALFIVLLSTILQSDYPIYLFNFYSLVSFITLVYLTNSKNTNFFTVKNLQFSILTYIAVQVTFLLFLSSLYRGNFYVFSEADAMHYHEFALEFTKDNIFNSANNYLIKNQVEDLGFVLVLGILYNIVESKLLLNIFNILLALYTAKYIFNICLIYISPKFSFLCALTYSISSYVIWFHASGLKESTMIFLIVASFYHYYNFIISRRSSSLTLTILFVGSLILFRPAIILLLLFSVVIATIIKQKFNYKSFFLVTIILCISVISSSLINQVTGRFIMNDKKEMFEILENEGMIKTNIQVTYAANIASSLIGPFPTLNTSKTLLSFFSSGLIFKMFLSFFFIFGVFKLLRLKQFLFYPLMVYFFIEALSLIYILEGLELRKSLTHFPAFFIIAFWYLDYLDKTKLNINKLKNLFGIFCFSTFILTIYWNFR